MRRADNIAFQSILYALMVLVLYYFFYHFNISLVPHNFFRFQSFFTMDVESNGSLQNGVMPMLPATAFSNQMFNPQLGGANGMSAGVPNLNFNLPQNAAAPGMSMTPPPQNMNQPPIAGALAMPLSLPFQNINQPSNAGASVMPFVQNSGLPGPQNINLFANPATITPSDPNAPQQNGFVPALLPAVPDPNFFQNPTMTAGFPNQIPNSVPFGLPPVPLPPPDQSANTPDPQQTAQPPLATAFRTSL